VDPVAGARGRDKDELEREVLERYSDWDNPIWIGFAIENFRAELETE